MSGCPYPGQAFQRKVWPPHITPALCCSMLFYSWDNREHLPNFFQLTCVNRKPKSGIQVDQQAKTLDKIPLPHFPDIPLTSIPDIPFISFPGIPLTPFPYLAGKMPNCNFLNNFFFNFYSRPPAQGLFPHHLQPQPPFQTPLFPIFPFLTQKSLNVTFLRSSLQTIMFIIM